MSHEVARHFFHDLWTDTQTHTLTCRNAFAGQHHDAGEADTEDGTLAEVEHGERVRGLQRGRLVDLQVSVVLFRFILLVVEVLQPR